MYFNRLSSLSSTSELFSMSVYVYADVVYIGVIHPYHRPTCLLFTNAKKNVLCEKPLAMNTKEVQEILASAKMNNVFFMEVWMTKKLFIALILPPKSSVEESFWSQDVRGRSWSTVAEKECLQRDCSSFLIRNFYYIEFMVNSYNFQTTTTTTTKFFLAQFRKSKHNIQIGPWCIDSPERLLRSHPCCY